MSIEDKIQQNKILAPLTTFKIGGPAEYFCEAATEEDFFALFDWAKRKNLPVSILAGGSNVLVNDKGVRGLVISPGNCRLAVKGERIECGAGLKLAGLVHAAASNSLSGMEWAAGIPGSVGGAVCGNAGGFGSSIADSLETAAVLDARKRTLRVYSQRDCGFAYRDSHFKQDKNLLIWEATFRLRSGKAESVIKNMGAITEARDKAFPKLPSAGSVFKNLSIAYIEENNPVLAEKFRGQKLVRNGMAGAKWIISELDLPGKIIGGAKISLEHPNFIVNTGKATAEDVITLISLAKTQARNRLKLQLREEIVYLGFD